MKSRTVASTEVGVIDPYVSTRNFYDQNAESYAEATRSLLMDSLELFTKRLRRGARIIDLGCGSGRDLLSFSRLGFSAAGIDLSYRLAKSAAAYSKTPVVVGDMRSLPFPAESFDGAWASASLLHLRREDIQEALNDIQRVLQPGGYLFTSVKCGVGQGLDTKGRWFSYFEPHEWMAQLSQAGLQVIESTSSLQIAATLDKTQSVDWITCTSQKLL